MLIDRGTILCAHQALLAGQGLVRRVGDRWWQCCEQVGVSGVVLHSEWTGKSLRGSRSPDGGAAEKWGEWDATLLKCMGFRTRGTLG